MEIKPIIRRSSQGKKIGPLKIWTRLIPHSTETKARQGKPKMKPEIKEQMLQTAPINPEYHQKYFENFYPKKMEKFKDLLKLNQEDTNNLSRYITSNKIEVVIKTLPTKKSPGEDGFTTEFYQTLKKEWTPVLLKLFHKAEREGTPPISFEEASIIPILKLDKKTIKNYRPISVMNTYTQILKKILDNHIQEYIKIIYHNRVHFIPEIQGWFKMHKQINVIQDKNRWA